MTFLAASSLILSVTPAVSAQEDATVVATPPALTAESGGDKGADATENGGENAQDAQPQEGNAGRGRSVLTAIDHNDPAQAVHRPDELAMSVAIGSDGTADFDADDTAGNDSDAHNGIVRVNDTVDYRFQILAPANSDAQDATLTVTFPKGMEVRDIPGICGSGSTLEPQTAGSPALPLTDDSVNQLNEQTLTCKLGRLSQTTTNYLNLTAKVLNLVHHDQELKLVKAELTATGKDKTEVLQEQLPSVRASSRLKWDISKNSIALQPDSGYKYGPAEQPCFWDKSKNCFATRYAVLISAPAGGKGAMPAVGDVTFVDNLTPESLYGDRIQGEKLQKFKDNLEKYGSRVTLNDATFYDQPGNKIGARINGVMNGDATNSVRDSGTLSVRQDRPGEKATFTISRPDMTLITYPSQVAAPRGNALPGNKAYAVSIPFWVYTPVDTILEFGQVQPGAWSLETVNRYTELEITGFNGTKQTIDSPDQDKTNDYRTTISNINIKGKFDKVFTGVPGIPSNMAPREFSPGFAARGEGPIGGNTLTSGQITVAETQEVLSQLMLVGSTPAQPVPVSALMCDAWDNSRLHLHKREVPATTYSPNIAFQMVGTEGEETVWVSGYNNATLDNGKIGLATKRTQVPAIKVQYAAVNSRPVGNGPGAQCGDDVGPWFDDPAQVPGNDPTLLAQGVYSAVARVRVHTVIEGPKENSAVLGTGSRMAVSINLKVADTDNPAGDILPNFASVKTVPGQSVDLQGVLDYTGSRWGNSTYDPQKHTAVGSGDRLILAHAQVRIDKQVRKAGTEDYSDTPPQVSGGDPSTNKPADAVEFKIVPSITSGALTPGIYKDVVVEDCMPGELIYRDAEPKPTLVVPRLSANQDIPGRKRDACSAGQTYIRWEFPKSEVNKTMPIIRLTADVSPTAKNGSYVNHVEIWGEDDASVKKLRENTAPIQISNVAGIRLQKEALTPVLQVNHADAEHVDYNKWLVTLTNTLPTRGTNAPQNADIIDILPRQNWPQGVNANHVSKFNGTFELHEVVVKEGDKAGQQVKVLYTKDLNPEWNPRDAANKPGGRTVWCDSPENGQPVINTGECPATKAEVTAVRVQRPGVFNNGDKIVFQVDMLAKGNAHDDLYINRVAAAAENLIYTVGPLDRAERAVASSIGDYTWTDSDRDGQQGDRAVEKPIEGVVVFLSGEDDLGNKYGQEGKRALRVETNREGKYLFQGLRKGTYQISFGLPEGYERTAKNQGNNPTKDSDANPATGTTDDIVLSEAENRTDIDAGYTLPVYPFIVAKTLNANGSQGNTLFNIEYSCSAPGISETGTVVLQAGTVEVEAGQEKLVGLFRTGTTCSVTGETNVERPGYEIAQPIAPQEKQEVNDTGLKITVTNTYNPATGTFKVRKNVVGLPAEKTPPKFIINYTCVDPHNRPGFENVLNGTIELAAGEEKTSPVLPLGAECTLNERVDIVAGQDGHIEVAGYSRTAPAYENQTITVAIDPENAPQDKPAKAVVTNTYSPETGRFKVRKNVVGLPKEKTPAVFLIDYVCIDELKRPGFDDVLGGTIELAAGEEKTSPELPRGIECAIAERVNVPAGEKGHIDVPGYLRAEPAFDHATVATAADPETAPEDMPAKAVVTNTYSVETGTFKVTKRVNGLPDEKIPAAFTISYTCTDPHNRPGFDLTGELSVANGGEVTSPALPLGASCELREKVDNNIQVAGFSLAEPVYSNQAKTVVTAHDPATAETARMEVTNNYSRDMGKIAVKKAVTVDGTKESKADARFGVLVECVDPVTAHKLSDQPHRLELSGDGTAVEYANIPTGYVCSLSEEPAPRAGFTHVPSFDQQTVTINDKDQVVNVTVTNAYTRDKGGFKVSKMVTGNAAALVKDKTFTFRYECADNFTGTVTLKNGESKSVTEVPTGTCVVTEENAKVDNAAVTTTMQVNEGEFTETNSVRFEVTKDQRDPANTIKIAAINNYVADVAPFKVLKTATADENQQLLAQGLGDRNIVFDYTCTPAYEGAYAEGGEISVKPNGDAAISAKQYPIGTSCTLVEKTAGAQVAGFALEAVRPLTVEVTAGAAPAEVRAVNRYTRDKGGFTVTKRVDGNAAVLAQGKAFEFTYTCADGVTETFTLKHGEKKQVANIPTGDCTITEKAAEVAHTIPTTTIRINDAVVQGATATFRVDKSAPDAVITVDVTNTYAPVQAPFMVKKIASADLDNTVLAERIAERDFVFDYTCTPAYEGAFAEGGEIRVKAGGEAVASPKTYPIGTACTLVEREDSATVAGFTHSGLAPLKVVVAGGENPAEVVADNRYTREEGTFGVVKEVKGWPWFSNETFTFDYTCKRPEAAEAITGQLKVKGDGIAVESGVKLPFGTQCRVRENVEDAERFGFVLQAPEEIEFTITEDVPVATAIAVNTYIPWIPILIPLIPLIVAPFIPKHEPPAPPAQAQADAVGSATPKKGMAKGERVPAKAEEAKQLAQTGVDESLLWIIAIGLALVAAGAVTLRRGQS
ncbi:MAG: DUF5979 domain-containing protein [Corynebacterium sp.]|uniref:DUF5979 domain-containing protein n=1 Tax=Corynebacterium sp. TaxID=1720 RepID=UPI0026DCEE19|nr:DUF5979 domain-containing protein [Corynebacterium sp.]MDO4760598.1 DUF5979 domain-containing protein [Corynebacterium sp.]